MLSLPLITFAVFAWWRGISERSGKFFWYHVGAIAMGLAANAKGPAALLVLACLVGFICANRRWRELWEFVRSGAPLTLALVAAPWWVYANTRPEAEILRRELSDVARGRDHPGPPWMPPIYALEAALPWSGFVVLAIAAAAPRWRSHAVLRGLLTWAGAILIPLIVLPQKQDHYILPILPPLVLLVGWLCDRAVGGEDRPLQRATVWVLGGTTLAGLVASAAPMVGGWMAHKRISTLDWTVGALIALGMIRLIVAYHRRGLPAALGGAIVVGALVMATTLGLWAPSVENRGMGRAAARIEAEFGDAPYAFYPIESLPLVFEMRRCIPVYSTRDELVAEAQKRGGLVVICEQNEAAIDRPPAQGMVLSFPMKKKLLRVFWTGRPDNESGR